MNWIEKHSINCYFCGELVDERECVPNTKEYGGNNDGGEICPKCQKERKEMRERKECQRITKCPFIPEEDIQTDKFRNCIYFYPSILTQFLELPLFYKYLIFINIVCGGSLIYILYQIIFKNAWHLF